MSAGAVHFEGKGGGEGEPEGRHARSATGGRASSCRRPFPFLPFLPCHPCRPPVNEIAVTSGVAGTPQPLHQCLMIEGQIRRAKAHPPYPARTLTRPAARTRMFEDAAVQRRGIHEGPSYQLHRRGRCAGENVHGGFGGGAQLCLRERKAQPRRSQHLVTRDVAPRIPSSEPDWGAGKAIKCACQLTSPAMILKKLDAFKNENPFFELYRENTTDIKIKCALKLETDLISRISSIRSIIIIRIIITIIKIKYLSSHSSNSSPDFVL